jgi:hypothetical protein
MIRIFAFAAPVALAASMLMATTVQAAMMINYTTITPETAEEFGDSSGLVASGATPTTVPGAFSAFEFNGFTASTNSGFVGSSNNGTGCNNSDRCLGFTVSASLNELSALDAGTTQLGFELFRGSLTPSQDVVVTVTDLLSDQVQFTLSNEGLFGFEDQDGIDSVRIQAFGTNSAQNFSIDSVITSTGGATAVPLPATLTFLLGGLGFLVLVGRRR